METSLARLLELQQVDTEAAQLRASIAALPRHLATVEEKLRVARETLDNIQKSLKAEEVQRRGTESDIKDQRQKIARFKDQSSSVKNNEQFHALQHEISFAEQEITRLEDGELESMERSEALELRRKVAEQELAAQTALVAQEQETARTQSSVQQARVHKLQSERTAVRKLVDATLLATYDRIAASRGTGIARVQGQRCYGCQMFLRPQMWNQVRTGQISTCESCSRLLAFDPALEPAPEPPKPAPKKRKKVSEPVTEDAADEFA